MIGNKIYLYKAPWNYSTLYQPYFKSEAARDSYLNMLEGLDATPKNGNVNIHFDYNLELTVIIPIDITTVLKYNYSRIVYNGVQFFCNIIDYKQISVNNTELQLRRHIIGEKVNFFQYFERFQIGRATFSENFSYGKDTKFVIPPMRTVSKRVTPAVKMHTINADGTEVTDNVYYRPFYVLYLPQEANPAYGVPTYLYGQTTQYNICIIPANLDDYNISDYSSSAITEVNYRSEDYFIEGSEKYNKLDTYYGLLAVSDLATLSPQIKSIELVFLPISRFNNMLPYIWEKVTFSGIEAMDFLMLDQTKLFAADSEGHVTKHFNEYYSFDVDIEQENLFNNLTLIFGIDENRYTFPVYEKKNTVGKLEVQVCFLFDVNGSSYQVRVVGDSNSVKEDIQTVKTFPFLCDYTFLLDQDSNFDAQNKYYDAMTRNAKRQKTVGGIINATTEFALGEAQLGFAQVMGPAGKMANISMGVGNILRGVGTIANTVNDVISYERERNLYKANEKAKPDILISGDNAYSRGLEWKGQISYIIEFPFTEDYSSWIDDKETYGVDCDIHRNTIDISEFIVNNKFFLQAMPVKADNAVLTVQEYNEMYELITVGCRYFLVQ